MAHEPGMACGALSAALTSYERGDRISNDAGDKAASPLEGALPVETLGVRPSLTCTITYWCTLRGLPLHCRPSLWSVATIACSPSPYEVGCVQYGVVGKRSAGAC